MGHKQRQHFPSKAGLPDIPSQAASSSEANVPLVASISEDAARIRHPTSGHLATTA